MRNRVVQKKAQAASGSKSVGGHKKSPDLHESSEFGRTLLQSAPYPILVTDLDTSINYVNPAFERLTGYISEELLGQKSPYPWWPPEKQQEYGEANGPGRTKELNELERYYRKKNGELFWVTLHIAPVKFDGKTRCFIAIWIDFTEQRRAEQEADSLRQIMSHVSRVNTLGELATSLAHELNQPLTAIMNNSSTALRMIRNGKVDIREITGILEDITADDQRAADIIRRMREPLKRSELKQELLDVNCFINDIYPLVRNNAALAGATIEMKKAPVLPLIKGDRTQLQQVLLNLIVNAFESVKESNVRFRWIGVRSSTNDDRSIKVEVSDSGPGVPEKNRQHLFEPFYTTKPDSLGVGLSICKNIVEDHGGRIWYEDRPGGGATFIFTLPVDQETSPDREGHE
jgi:PAS domain S-box-containing protein